MSEKIPASKTGLKRFLHAPVFAGMKCQNRHATAGIQARGQVAEKSVERGKFIVHRDAQRLEDAADGEVAIILVQTRQHGADGRGEGFGGGESFSGEGRSERGGVRFIGVFDKQSGERVGD